MADVKVMSAGAVKEMVAMLGAEFEKATGAKVDYHFGTAGSLRARVEQGEAADLIILSQSAIATLAAQDLVLADSVIDLAASETCVVVREGATRPDISTVAAFKQALLDARSVAYVDPKAGGSSGTMFAAMLDKLGIAEEVNKKAVLGRNGHDVAGSVADGHAEIGTTFISEVLPVKGAAIAGPLPGELYNSNTYTAAIHTGSVHAETAREFLAALTAPEDSKRWETAGLKPVF